MFGRTSSSVFELNNYYIYMHIAGIYIVQIMNMPLINSHQCRYTHVQGQANGSSQSSHQLQRKKVSCLKWDSNLRSPACITGAPPTKPPRQLSTLGTNPSNDRMLGRDETSFTCSLIPKYVCKLSNKSVHITVTYHMHELVHMLQRG